MITSSNIATKVDYGDLYKIQGKLTKKLPEDVEEVEIILSMNEETDDLNEETDLVKAIVNKSCDLFKPYKAVYEVKETDEELESIHSAIITVSDEGNIIAKVKCSVTKRNTDGDIISYVRIGKSEFCPSFYSRIKGTDEKTVLKDAANTLYVLLKKYASVFVSRASEIYEEYDPFKDMKKLPDDTEMKSGLYTDGWGHVFEPPKNKKSKRIKYNKKSYFYDYGKRVLICKYGDETETTSLNLANWLDNPEYWIEEFDKEIENRSK